MFEIPTLGRIIQTIIVIALVYYTYRLSKEHEQESEKKSKEQQELIDATNHPILTQKDFKNHMQTCLEKLSSNTISAVTITDKKEEAQWVVLAFLEYEKLCYRAQALSAVEMEAVVHIRYKDGTSKSISLGDMLIHTRLS